MSRVSNLKAHPAHNMSIVPTQVSRLFYTRRGQMTVARGARATAFSTSKGEQASLIWCEDLGWKVGLVRGEDGVRLMSVEELNLASRWIDARLAQAEAVERANDRLPAVEAPRPLSAPTLSAQTPDMEQNSEDIDPELAEFMSAFPHAQAY